MLFSSCFSSEVGRARLLLVCLLIAAALCGIAYAQETSGSIRGAVTDASGAAVPSATVELSGALIPRPFTTTTAANGEFLFARVPPGPGYSVTVTATGFRSSKAANVNAELGKAVTLDFKLEVGAVTESVVVTADAVMVDTQSSASSVTVDKSFFDLLPKGRSYYDLIGVAPGARNEAKTGGYQIDGSSGSENVYFLDGMNVTGIQQGTLSAQAQIPVEMVQQLEVKNGIMEAQYGGAMGGVVNAVVRSGSNQIHGEAGFYFNNDGMQARNRPTLRLDPFDDNLAQYVVYCGYGGTCENPSDRFRTWQPVFSVGGPLVKNRLFFFSSYSPVHTSTERNVNYIDGPQNQHYASTTTDQYLATKLDYVPFSKLRVDMSWVFNPVKVSGILPSAAGTDSPTAAWKDQGNYTSGGILSGNVNYTATTKLLFSFHGGWMRTNYNNMYTTPTDTPIYYTNSNIGMPGIPDSLQHAAGWLTQAVAVDKQDTYERKNFDASFSYIFNAGGEHSIKGGWAINQLYNNVFNSTYQSGYYRYYWDLTYHCVTSQCTTGTGPYGYYRYRVLGTIGKASSNNQGIFLQDNWRVSKRLTLNLGLRTEHEFVPSFSSDPTLPSSAITFGWGQKLSPRIGGAYDLKGNGKQKLYASFGFFYDVMKYELPRGSFGGDVWREWYHTIDDPNIVNSNQGFAADPTKLPGTFLEMVDWRIPSNDPNNPAAQILGRGSLIDPNLKPMKMRMVDVGYDFSIAPTLVASARYTSRRLIRTIEDTGFLSPNGEAYMIANPGEGRTADQSLWSQLWAPGVPLPPKPVRKYDAVELRLDKRLSRNYQFAFSYTWSRLWGNYSGLASSDESDANGNGRTSPDVNRYYDEPWVGVKQTGQYAFGRLATDRPHTLKLFGTYSLHSKLGYTTFSPIASAYSGTLGTTEVPVISSTPAFPFGRGDLGRTPFFFNTDFSVAQEFAPFKNHEAMRIKFQFMVYNLFNSTTSLQVYKTISHQNDGQLQFNDADGNPAYQNVFAGFDTRSLMAAQGIRQDPEYGMPQVFQSPRSLRLHLTFVF
ncbi:MAG: TonB-dependent receptor [Bryobacteraceae bacterium]